MNTPTILFLCPHHAAKSVMAAAYFNQLAQQKGLAITAISAGTDPSEAIMPAVAELLASEGLNVSGQTPRRVTPDELAQVQRIVSMGCTAEELGVAPERLTLWNDVPPASQNLLGTREALLAHINELLLEL